jgi:hypothetical protein
MKLDLAQYVDLNPEDPGPWWSLKRQKPKGQLAWSNLGDPLGQPKTRVTQRNLGETGFFLTFFFNKPKKLSN